MNEDDDSTEDSEQANDVTTSIGTPLGKQRSPRLLRKLPQPPFNEDDSENPNCSQDADPCELHRDIFALLSEAEAEGGTEQVILAIRLWLRKEATGKDDPCQEKEACSTEQTAEYLMALSRLMDVAYEISLEKNKRPRGNRKKSDAQEVLAWTDRFLEQRVHLALSFFSERDVVLRQAYDIVLASMCRFCEGGDTVEPQGSEETVVRSELFGVMNFCATWGRKFLPAQPGELFYVPQWRSYRRMADEAKIDYLQTFAHLSAIGLRRRAHAIVKTGLQLLGLTGTEACGAMKHIEREIDKEERLSSRR